MKFLCGKIGGIVCILVGNLIVINWNCLMQNGADQTVRYVNFNYKLNFKKTNFVISPKTLIT
jgi:hypothetical protein